MNVGVGAINRFISPASPRLTIYKVVGDWLEAYAALASGQQALGFDQTPEWFEAYVKYIAEQPEDSLMLGVVDDGSGRQLLGMPLMSSVTGWLSIRCLTALANYYTSLFQPVFSVDVGSQDDVAASVVAALGEGALVWDEMSLEPMAGDSPFVAAFLRELCRDGYPHTVTECFTNWYLRVEERSYELYEQSLPSKLRNTLLRKERKLEREQGYTISLVQDDGELEQAIRDYETVYQKSWKSEEGCPAFIREIIVCFARKGWLRLGLMYVAGAPVAAQLWFVKDGVASIFKLSYDEAFAKYSVGSILTAAMMKQVMNVDRVSVVDFLTGDDSYKKDWMSHSRQRYRIRIFNKHSWRGWLLGVWNTKVKRLPLLS